MKTRPLAILLAALALAAANGAALPHDEHYPAAYLHKANIEEARKAEALGMAYLMRGHEGDEKERAFYASTDPDDWLRLDPHPLLSRVFPGAKLYLTSPAGDRDSRSFAAVRDDKYYILPEDVGRLLYDCGMRFENDDMPDWLRAIAIIRSAGPVRPDTSRQLAYRAGTLEGPNPRWARAWEQALRGELPYLPELVVDSVRLDTAVVADTIAWPRGRVCRAHIGMSRDGKPESLNVDVGVWKIDGKLVLYPTGIDHRAWLHKPQSSLDPADPIRAADTDRPDRPGPGW